jgi:HEAT repeat protein
MSAAPSWGQSPRQSIEAEAARRGQGSLVASCITLLSGQDTDDELVFALAGPAARAVLDGSSRADQRYWLRVWGARGLLWCWGDEALPEICQALADPCWRVREMAAKVVARHLLGDALPEVAVLRDDPVPRVAAAAVRALAALAAARA